MLTTRLAHLVFEDARGIRAKPPHVGAAAVLNIVYRILRDTRLCSLATVTPALRPHINVAYFCYSKRLVLYFLSHPNAQHCRNIRDHPSVSVTVCSPNQPWGAPSVGIQLFGTCRRVTGLEEREAERLYAKRFPAYRRWKSGESMGPAEREYAFYGLTVNSLKLLDEKVIGDALFVHASIRRGGESLTRRSPSPKFEDRP